MVTATENRISNPNIFTTPPPPDGMIQVDMSENARQVFERRYTRRGPDGDLIETAGCLSHC